MDESINVIQGHKERNSNIEFIKILAMCLIVICHVVAEIANDEYVNFDDYVFVYYLPSWMPEHLVLTIIHQLGYLGNTIFFTCSAWFLCCSKRANYKKIVCLLLDIEIVSVIFLLSAWVINKGNIHLPLGIKMLFPHTFRLFWYLTCYIVIYLIHPALNNIIFSLTQRKFLFFVVASSSVFIIYTYFVRWYFGSVFISWFVLYFLVAYVKLYMPRFQQNKKINFILIFMGFIGIVAVPLALNIIGTNIEKFSHLRLSWFDDIPRWNPFHIMVSISILNLVSLIKPKYSPLINYLSSLSLLCFVMHSNRIMRCYVVPYIWETLYINGFYNRLIITSLIFGLSYFLISMFMSAIYNKTIQKISNKFIAPVLYVRGEKCINKMLDTLMNKLK